MQIDHCSGFFVARCKVEERFAFQDAGWTWNRDLKAWATQSPEKAQVFAPFATDAAIQALGKAETRLQDALSLSHAADYPLDVPVPPGLSYDPHQRAGIYYASLRKDTLCADPPGLGKTATAIGLSNYLGGIRHVLIVCPLHLKVMWSREWVRWCVKGLSVGTAGSVTHRMREVGEDGKTVKNPVTGRAVYRSWTEKVWPGTDVVIVNYDQLPDFKDQIRARQWHLLIVDESHYLMNEAAERTRHVLGGGKQRKKKTVDGKLVKYWNPAISPIPADRRLFLSGTPITSRPLNIWPVVQAFDPLGMGKNWMTFVHRYCAAFKMADRLDVTGASNLEELQVKCRLKFMIRRDKELVMKALPPLRRQLIELPAEGLAKLVGREVSAMRAVRDALADFERTIRGEPAPADEAIDWPGLTAMLERRFGHLSNLDYVERFATLSPPEQVAFQELSTARKDLAAAKIPMVVEHLQNWLDAGEKVICFTAHTEMADALRDQFPGCGFITGKVAASKRQAEVDRFQNDPKCQLMIGNIVAAGTGLTMTASSIVVFAEMSWLPSDIEQCEARAWRRGQLKSVLSQHLVVEGSTDARLVEVLLQKQDIVRDALDISALTEKDRLLSAS